MPDYAKPLATVTVYRSHLGDCTNGGLSSRHNTLDLYSHDTESYQLDPAVADKAIKLVYRDYLDVLHAEPVDSPEANSIGWMAGGNIVSSIDSRIGKAVRATGKPGNFYGAIKLHDRQETQSQYNSLSR